MSSIKKLFSQISLFCSKYGCFFFRKKELCKLFKSKNSNENKNLVYTIEENAVTISLFHKVSLDYKRMSFVLNIPWDNFKLPIICWKETCSIAY